VNALRNMIEMAGSLIYQGDFAGTCRQLRDVYNRTDGLPNPPDFVIGDAASDLASQILDLIASVACGQELKP